MPLRCPRCGSARLWGHGFAARYFEGFGKCLWVKRFRCSDCFAVHTCRPLGFLRFIRFMRTFDLKRMDIRPQRESYPAWLLRSSSSSSPERESMKPAPWLMVFRSLTITVGPTTAMVLRLCTWNGPSSTVTGRWFYRERPVHVYVDQPAYHSHPYRSAIDYGMDTAATGESTSITLIIAGNRPRRGRRLPKIRLQYQTVWAGRAGRLPKGLGAAQPLPSRPLEDSHLQAAAPAVHAS